METAESLETMRFDQKCSIGSYRFTSSDFDTQRATSHHPADLDISCPQLPMRCGWWSLELAHEELGIVFLGILTSLRQTAVPMACRHALLSCSYAVGSPTASYILSTSSLYNHPSHFLRGCWPM